MSIEAKIEALTAAIVTLTAKLESSNVAPGAPVAPAPAPVVKAAPITVATVTAVDPVPEPVAQVVTAPVMPAPPLFVAPVVQAAVPAGAPFNDAKGLMEYVLTAYKAMGQYRGAGIQSVLTTLGYQNINEIKPEHYSALYAGVEALK